MFLILLAFSPFFIELFGCIHAVERAEEKVPRPPFYYVVCCRDALLRPANMDAQMQAKF